MNNKIVVGLDGSEGSAQALRFAYDEAARRGAQIEAVHVWHYPYSGGMMVYAIPETDLEAGARQVVARSLDQAGPIPDGVKLDTIVLRGAAAQVLIDRAQDADLLVVGSRGHGGFVGLLLGSVSQQCAHHSPCPVVIVHPEPVAGPQANG